MTQNKEENHLIEERRKKLADLRASNNAFPNDFRRKNLAQELKDELDQFSKEELAKKNNIGLVYINSNYKKRDGDDSYEEMKKHAKKMNYRFPYLLDEKSKLANSFGAKTTPHIFMFNSNLQLAYKGAIDDNYEDINKVKDALAPNTQKRSGMYEKIQKHFKTVSRHSEFFSEAFRKRFVMTIGTT